jgi:hypothetical protein
MKLPVFPPPQTQTVVDKAMQLAESWIREDADRRAARKPPSDYEPSAQALASYLHRAISEVARSYAQGYGEAVREECAKVCDDAAAHNDPAEDCATRIRHGTPL